MNIKKVVSVIVAIAMLFAISSQAFAVSERSYRKYANYVCLGDSIAAGCGLSKDGSETTFEISNDEHPEAYSSEYLYRGYDFDVAPNAYHSLIANTLGVNLSQCARSGLRAVELRYMLDGIYNDFEKSFLWGSQFFTDNFVKLFSGEDVDVMAQLEKMKVQSNIVNSVKNADLITINLGSNDVFSFTLLYSMNQLIADFPILSDVSEVFKATGNLGLAIGSLIDLAATVGKLPIIVESIMRNLGLTYEQFVDNYTALIERILTINPDATIVLVGVYNPLKNMHISSDTKLDPRALIAPVVDSMNVFYRELADRYANCRYADVTDTDIYRLNLTDPGLTDLSLLKVHPTISGYRYMAQQILGCLPSGVAAPTLSAAVNAESGYVSLNWTKCKAAKSYNVYRADSEKGVYKLVGTSKTESYKDKSVTEGNDYYYKVTALNGSVEGSFSNTVVCSYGCAAPVLKAVNDPETGKIVLSWNAVNGAVKYELWRAASKTGTYKKLCTTTKLSVTNGNANVGSTYYYKVRAVKSDGEKSKFSAVVSRAYDCAAPVVTVTTSPSTGKPYITWDKVPGAAKYEVWSKSSAKGEFKKLKTVSGTHLTNSSAKVGSVYYYKVKAISADRQSANSAFSAQVSVTCRCAAPDVSISLSVLGNPKLKWAAVDDAVKYVVYRADSKNGEYKKVFTTLGRSFTNISTLKGHTYYYKVVAVSHIGSNADSAPSAPVGIKAK